MIFFLFGEIFVNDVEGIARAMKIFRAMRCYSTLIGVEFYRNFDYKVLKKRFIFLRIGVTACTIDQRLLQSRP